MMVHPKILPAHLARQAYVYVRQSTLRQVLHHAESTERQYALAQRACALGWQAAQVITIDEIRVTRVPRLAIAPAFKN